MISFPIQISTEEIPELLIGKIVKIKFCGSLTPEYSLRFSKKAHYRKGTLSGEGTKVSRHLSLTYQEDPKLAIGDVLEITNDRAFLLIDTNSKDNALVVNTNCNLCCINCPQTSLVVDPRQQERIKQILELLPSSIATIGLTGGEPTLDIPNLCSVIKGLYKKNPDMHIDILTNSIKLSDWNSLTSLVKVLKNDSFFCIALYGDTPKLHDLHTQVPGSFEKAIRALHNLAMYERKIELRYVIDNLNYQRLPSFIEFVYENLPFVDHISLMGMEYNGNAEKNAESLFINPSDYASSLLQAVQKARFREMEIYIYNHQLCKIPEKLWDFAVPTISGWKRGYHPACKECDVIGYCGGFFLTSNSLYVDDQVKPICLDVDKEN
jgi:His-Xaa-Ser system radical SAM maturase HxsC